MKQTFSAATLLALALLPSGCRMNQGSGKPSNISLSEIARQATPTLNALLEAGKKNDAAAGLKTFAPSQQNEGALKSLFSSRREVFNSFRPIVAADSSYSSIGGGNFWEGNADWTRLEAKVPNVVGVSVRADVVNEGGWKLVKLEFFSTPN